MNKPEQTVITLNPETPKPKRSRKPKRTIAAIVEDFATLAKLDGETPEAFLEMFYASAREFMEGEIGKRRVQFALDEAKRRKGCES